VAKRGGVVQAKGLNEWCEESQADWPLVAQQKDLRTFSVQRKGGREMFFWANRECSFSPGFRRGARVQRESEAVLAGKPAF